MPPTRARAVAAGLAVLLLSGCRSHGDEPPRPSGAATPPPPAVTPPPSGLPTPTPSAPFEPGTPPADAQTKARELVQTWNDALSRHDVAALSRLYADSVVFYGQQLPRARISALKAAAFGAAPSFTQEIAQLTSELLPGSGGAVGLRFRKRSGTAGKLSRIGARLVVAPDHDGALRITLESDDATDARLAAHSAQASDESCEAAALTAIQSAPDVLREWQRVAKESPEVRPGGLGDPIENDGLVELQLGFWHDDPGCDEKPCSRFETRIFAQVARGELTAAWSIEAKPVLLTPEARARVRAACRSTK
jgi:hypothetical protein